MVDQILVSTRETNREFIQNGKITHVYGPPKIGKSTLSANLALELVKIGKKVSIISTERPIEIRMDSMIEANTRYSIDLLESILTSDIFTFTELIEVITNTLPNYELKVDLLIIDSLTACYRQNSGPINLTLLRKALASLQSLAINKNLAIMFTNQVASLMNESNDYRPVASATTRNYSDITIRLSQKNDGRAEITIEDIFGEEIEVLNPAFTITEIGIEEFDQLFIIPEE
ncbi:MAG: AAA family ATPase [Candidatus Heimdallarchaeota archaeon]